MGLGSEAMLAQSVASALAATNGQTAEAARRLTRSVSTGPEQALERLGFEQGGVLLAAVDRAEPEVVRHHILAQPDREAWAFVLHLPPRPRAASPGLEAERRARVLQTATFAGVETGAVIMSELWPALERDDLPGFARALEQLQALNRAAFQKAGADEQPSPETEAVLDFMRQNGAVAAGESLTGLARWGLVRGARPSVALRHALTHHVGFENGTVMASICATGGATVGEAAAARTL
jgi:predicted sugar kinase